MLTQEDLQNIEAIFDRRFNKLENRFDNLENHFDNLENRFDNLENRFDNLENRFDNLENRFDNLENRFDNLENRIDSFENLTNKKFDAVIERIDELESETTKSFALLENDILPKITALFDARELNVTKEEFQEYQEEVDSKLQYIDPLVVKTKSLSESVKALEEQQETA